MPDRRDTEKLTGEAAIDQMVARQTTTSQGMKALIEMARRANHRARLASYGVILLTILEIVRDGRAWLT